MEQRHRTHWGLWDQTALCPRIYTGNGIKNRQHRYCTTANRGRQATRWKAQRVRVLLKESVWRDTEIRGQTDRELLDSTQTLFTWGYLRTCFVTRKPDALITTHLSESRQSQTNITDKWLETLEERIQKITGLTLTYTHTCRSGLLPLNKPSLSAFGNTHTLTTLTSALEKEKRIIHILSW